MLYVLGGECHSLAAEEEGDEGLSGSIAIMVDKMLDERPVAEDGKRTIIAVIRAVESKDITMLSLPPLVRIRISAAVELQV
jgi:hypothetical protein